MRFYFHNSVFLQSFRNKSMSNISFISFREQFVKYGCFSVNQVKTWHNNFDTNNLTRWCKQGLLIRLRQGWYAFSECRQIPEFARYFP